MIPTREEAFALLRKYNQGESLLKHALSVEAVMRHFAIIYHEDPEKWGIIGFQKKIVIWNAFSIFNYDHHETQKLS